MFDHRRLSKDRGRAPEVMSPHMFAHSDIAYEVRFQRMDGQWFARLHLAASDESRPLLPLEDEVAAGLSDPSIRIGFIAVAEWLVKTGRWPDAETRSLHQRTVPAIAA